MAAETKPGINIRIHEGLGGRQVSGVRDTYIDLRTPLEPSETIELRSTDNFRDLTSERKNDYSHFKFPGRPNNWHLGYAVLLANTLMQIRNAEEALIVVEFTGQAAQPLYLLPGFDKELAS